MEESQHQALLTWIKQEWIPSLTSEINLLKMINTPHEGHTYCVQIIVENEDQIQDFQRECVTALQKHIADYHNEKAFIFDSIMQYI